MSRSDFRSALVSGAQKSGALELVGFVVDRVKGQIISKCLFVSSISSKKQTKTCRTVVKTNSFVHFLEEFMAFEICN